MPNSTHGHDELQAALKDVMADRDQDIPSSTKITFEVPRAPVRATRRLVPLLAGGIVVAVVGGGFLLSTVFGPTNQAVSGLAPTSLAVAGESGSSAAAAAASTRESPTVGGESESAATPTASSSLQSPDVGADGTLRFHGLSWQVPGQWVHSSYDLPCSEPITDYAMIVTHATGPAKACLSLGPPVSGILIAGNDVAGTWMATGIATKSIELNGLSALTGIDRDGNTVVVIPAYSTAFRIQADPTLVQQILASVRPYSG